MDMKELKTLKDNYEKLLREKGQEIMKGAVEEFFKANPEIKTVTWTQYTPFFNDGEPCEFRVGDPYFSMQDVEPEDVPRDPEDDDGQRFYSTWGAKYYANARPGMNLAPIEKAGQSFRETIGAAPHDLFLAAFGDHMKVVLTPDQIYTEEVNHD